MLAKGTSAADVFAEMSSPKGQYACAGMVVLMQCRSEEVFRQVRNLIPADLMNPLERRLFHRAVITGSCSWRIPEEMFRAFHEDYRRILQRLIDYEVVSGVQPDVAMLLRAPREDTQCNGK